jgi:hypothetical protein
VDFGIPLQRDGVLSGFEDRKAGFLQLPRQVGGEYSISDVPIPAANDLIIGRILLAKGCIVSEQPASCRPEVWGDRAIGPKLAFGCAARHVAPGPRGVRGKSGDCHHIPQRGPL